MTAGPTTGARATDTSRAIWIVIGVLAASMLAMWLPAWDTPFWGDDYVFLLHARAAHLSSAPWWSDFWPASPVAFWRPLSQEGYWRLMYAAFGASALAMHLANLVLLVLASASVGVLAHAVARACRWPGARSTAAFAGVLYGTLAMHMLPVHWASAANSSMLVVFTALALAAWTRAFDAAGVRRIVLLTAVPVLQALALLTKESAALTPILLTLVGLFVCRRRWRRGTVVTLAACVAIVVVWWVLDAHFTTATKAAYGLTLGTNVARNALAFVAWMLNVPREAVRMAAIGNRWIALAWMAATAGPMLAAWLIALWRGHTLLSRRRWLVVVAFAIIAYGPYFLFAWNSYAYYAAIAAIVPIVALAHVGVHTRRAWIIATLIAASSWIAVAGTRHVGQPGLIARADWGERLLQQLQRESVRAPLRVAASDTQRFYAIGKAGLAWRLGIDPAAIHLVAQCPANAGPCIVIAKNGRWHWRHAGAARQ